MTSRFLFLIAAVASCFFGVREMYNCSRDLVAYCSDKQSPYEAIKCADITRYDEVRLKYGAGTQPIVTLVSVNGSRVAIKDLPASISSPTVLVKRVKGLDSSVSQLTGERLPVYDYINSMCFHFSFCYGVGFVLLLLSILMFIASYFVNHPERSRSARACETKTHT